MTKKLAILGANGLLGRDLVTSLSSSFDTIQITRENYEEQKGKEFDLFINANGNSKKFWALQNIFQDFEASTITVYNTMFDFQFKKYIYISSVDVYPNPSRPEKTLEDQVIKITEQNTYGFHKYLSEQIVRKHASDWIILRPSNILGTTLRKGPFFDIRNGNPLFVKLDTKLQVITSGAIAGIVNLLWNKNVTNEVVNVGGVGVFDFKNINKHFHQKIKISAEAKTQIYEMNVEKVKQLYPDLKTSEEYLSEFLKDYKKI